MGIEGREEEDEKPWWDIEFFEGKGFLGAISEILEKRAKRKKKKNTVEEMLRNGKRKEEQYMGMHENVTWKRNCIMGKNTIQTMALTNF